jgi:tetratricopeptide (TPR) repeat protein
MDNAASLQTGQTSDFQLEDRLEGTHSRGRHSPFAIVHVSLGPYIATSLFFLFFSVWCFRDGSDLVALGFVTIAIVIIPLLSYFERIRFDGVTLVRSGIVSFCMRMIMGSRISLKVEDIERVESSALRTFRNGGRVYYRYRSEIVGRGLTFVIASGGKSYRRMVHELFCRISEAKLDLKSVELRDFICEPERLRASLSTLNFAPATVLDSATATLFVRGRRNSSNTATDRETISSYTFDRAQALRLVANQLRIIGRLRDAAEAFRRATPGLKNDPTLTLEFARLLQSSAGLSRNQIMARRSIAALRLAAHRAKENSALLLRIGESMVDAGEIERARTIFEKVLKLDPAKYRASLGLADIALRDGKLAHVIHHFYNAARETDQPALVRFAEREAAYFKRLNDDDEYLDSELSRINWLQNLEQFRNLALRVVTLGMILALLGPAVDETVAAVGWFIATIAITFWIIALSGRRWLSQRRRFRELAEDVQN